MYKIYYSETEASEFIYAADHKDSYVEAVEVAQEVAKHRPWVGIYADTPIGEVSAREWKDGRVVFTGSEIFNVYYDTSEGVKSYCLSSMDYPTAEECLQDFKDRYIDPETGVGKLYPNGQGMYDIRNPRIGCVDCLNGKVGEKVGLSDLR